MDNVSWRKESSMTLFGNGSDVLVVAMFSESATLTGKGSDALVATVCCVSAPPIGKE
jgi:hypothetical protein